MNNGEINSGKMRRKESYGSCKKLRRCNSGSVQMKKRNDITGWHKQAESTNMSQDPQNVSYIGLHNKAQRRSFLNPCSVLQKTRRRFLLFKVLNIVSV